jgi:hypothetical protein
MSEINLTREEQETIIRSNAASKTWEVVTADPRIMRRMERQGYQADPRKNPWGYVSFTIPFDRVKILKPKPKLTEQQLANLAKGNRFVSTRGDSLDEKESKDPIP